MMDREIIFAKVYSKTRKPLLKFALHFPHRNGKIFKTTAVSYLSAVVMSARMAQMVASDWSRGCHGNGNRRPLGSWAQGEVT